MRGDRRRPGRAEANVRGVPPLHEVSADQARPCPSPAAPIPGPSPRRGGGRVTEIAAVWVCFGVGRGRGSGHALVAVQLLQACAAGEWFRTCWQAVDFYCAELPGCPAPRPRARLTYAAHVNPYKPPSEPTKKGKRRGWLIGLVVFVLFLVFYQLMQPKLIQRPKNHGVDGVRSIQTPLQTRPPRGGSDSFASVRMACCSPLQRVGTHSGRRHDDD